MIVHRRTQTQIHVHRIPCIPIGAGVTRCTLTYAVQSIAPFYPYQTNTICTVSPNMERTYVQRVRKHRTVLEGSSWSASYHCTWCSCRSTEHKKTDTSQNRQQTVYCYLTHTHTHTFNGHLSGTTQVNRYQKGKTNLDFTEARDSEWQWHQLGHMQVCTSLQTDNHASTPPLSFLQA